MKISRLSWHATKKDICFADVLFCGFRRPQGGSTLQDFNARGGRAAPAPRFCLRQNARTAHQRRRPEGRLVVLLQRSRPSKISILTVPSTKKASAKQIPFLWITQPISALRSAPERRLRAQLAGVLAWSANACAVRGGERAAQCPDVAFRPRIPTRSRAAKKSRAGAAGSLNRMMPAIRAPRAPIPVQMA